MARGIYKIFNIKNNKFYIGSAVDFTKRKRMHVWKLRKGTHANKHLQSAWNKYGEESFIFVLVQHVAETVNLLEEENQWLKKSFGTPNCYNIAESATAFGLGKTGEKNSMYGKTFAHTSEAIAKIAAASSGRKQDAETIQRKTAHLIGKPKTAAVRAKISATLSGEGNFWYGKERSEDFKSKIRKAVVVTDAAGVETIYPSVQAVREALQLKPPTVNRALKSGLALVRGPHTGLSFKYVTPALNV
tara:strand:- start:42 stop:776 length:735 start_codon:yes stop_codon:yes gene_type:complete